MSNEDESAVIAALERGDRERAIRELVRAYGDAIYRFVRQMVGTDDLADDVWQNVFFQAYEGLGRFERRSSVRAWLYGIARHRSLDAIKIRRRRDKRFVADEAIADNPDAEPVADEQLGGRQLVRALGECMDELAPDRRTVVLLHYREGFTYQQIADIVGKKPATLRAWVSRAFPALRACVERKGVL